MRTREADRAVELIRVPRTGTGRHRIDRSPTPHLVGLIWALLVVNTLGSSGEGTVIPIPTTVAQLVTMGSLAVAFVLALLLNPGLRIRPSAFLLLLAVLVVVSVVSSAFLMSGPGALLRGARFAVFVATLWLITPWWDGTLTFVRYHVRALFAVLLTAVIGLALAPSLAMPEAYDGRLVDALWYLTPPRLAQYAAVVAGLTLLLWLARHVKARTALVIGGGAVAILLMTHTRTATVALVAAVLVGGFTLALANVRARRALTVVTVVAGLTATVFGSALLSWFRRGQGEDALDNLTGRQKVWDALLAQPRSVREQLLGFGLGDKSFQGLPIDSGWLAIYQEQGYLGIAIVVAFLLVLLMSAATRPSSPARACAFFLIVYCAIASYTEVGLGDASTYLLHLAVAGSLLTFPANDVPVHTPGSHEALHSLQAHPYNPVPLDRTER